MESTGYLHQSSNSSELQQQEQPKAMPTSPTSSQVLKSPFALATMVASSPTCELRKRSISLANTFERNAQACLDNFHGRLSKYFSDNEKVKFLMKNDAEQVKVDLRKRDDEIEKIRMENLILKTRLEEMQIRLGENERNLTSVRYENDNLLKKNIKFECKIEELDHAMTDMIKMKDSVIQSLTDQFSVLCKELAQREGSIMELYKKQLLENQQVEVKSQQLQNKVKLNLKELANLTNLVSQLQMESVKNKKEYESSIIQLKEEYRNQLGKMSEIQKSFLPHHYQEDDDFSKQKVFYENQIISLKKELYQLQEKYENHRRLTKESNELLLISLSERNNEISKLKSVTISLNDKVADLKAQLEKTSEVKISKSTTHLQIIIPPSPTIPNAMSPSIVAAALSPLSPKLVH